jgi:DNA-binding transcriptional MerR regulator
LKISELSQRSGRPVATIKYYLREGLLPAGRPTAVNQADYAPSHLERIRLVTTLVDVGGLSIDAVKRVVAAIEDDSLTLHNALGVAHHALAPPQSAGEPAADLVDAVRDVDRFLAGLGWRTKPEAPARTELARALASLQQLGWQVDATVFSRYAQTVDDLAEWELDQTPTDGSRSQVVQSVVVGTVVFERALVALRRLAQEHQSAIKQLRIALPEPPS